MTLQTGETSGSGEISGSGYVRLKIGPSASGWTIPGITSPSGLIYNTENIYVTVTNTAPWGLIYGAFINTDSTGGERLMTLPFEAPVNVTASGGFMFSASNLKINVS